MALVVKDRVKVVSTTTGTGTFTLGATVAGFQGFSVIGNGNTTYYTITDDAGNWEVGIGTYTASGTTLSRDTVLESSNANAKVSFPAGNKVVFVSYPADRSVMTDGTTIQGNISGNAATVTNGVYTSGTYADPSWLTSVSGSKVSGNISGNAANVTGTVAVANGGTGATTAAGALTNLGAYAASNPSGYTSNTGTVTSVAMTVPTGLSISGSPVTTTGTLALTLTTGYSIPTTASQTNWDSAYTQRMQWDGGSTNLVAATGRTSLGGTTVGQNFYTLTNPTAITFPRINADNTVSALDAATFRTAIGAGTGSGTVTSVTGTSPVASSGGATPAISLASGYGDTQNPYASKTAKYVLAAPNGAAGVPTFRALVASDIPTLNQNTTGTAANVTGTVAIANGGTGQTTKAAAYNALTPITSTGDLVIGNGTNSATRLAIGTSGQVLASTGTTAAWTTVAQSGISQQPSTTVTSKTITCGTASDVTIVHRCVLDANNEFLLINSNTTVGLYGVVYNSSTDTMGSATAIRTGVTITDAMCYTLSSSSVLVMSRPNSQAVQAVVLSISGTTITVNTAASATLGNSGTGTFIGNFVAVGSSYVWSYPYYNGTSYVFGAVALTISGTTITFGSQTKIHSTYTSSTAADYGQKTYSMSSTVFAVCVGVENTSQYPAVITASVSGTTITAGSGATVGTVYGTYCVFIDKLASGRIAMLVARSGAIQGYIFSISGTTVTGTGVGISSGTNVTTSAFGYTVGSQVFSYDGSGRVGLLSDVSGTATASATSLTFNTTADTPAWFLGSAVYVVNSSNGVSKATISGNDLSDSVFVDTAFGYSVSSNRMYLLPKTLTGDSLSKYLSSTMLVGSTYAMPVPLSNSPSIGMCGTAAGTTLFACENTYARSYYTDGCNGNFNVLWSVNYPYSKSSNSFTLSKVTLS